MKYQGIHKLMPATKSRNKGDHEFWNHEMWGSPVLSKVLSKMQTSAVKVWWLCKKLIQKSRGEGREEAINWVLLKSL